MPVVTFKAKSNLVHDKSLEVLNHVRDFKLTADEPTDLGGTDKGMNPVEMLLCALGSCQAIVARAFAKANNIELEAYWVEVEGDLDTDGFLKGVEGVRNGFQEIRFTPHFKTTASREDVERFQTFIDSRCPVGDNLLNSVPIVVANVVID